MPIIKAVIEYDGTDYSGFQKQPSRRTVQGELERALTNLFKQDRVKVIGAGRTDAGVHATGQVISFPSPERFPIDRIPPATNGLLPKSIRIKSAEPAPEKFHARYSAKRRTYEYVILNREAPAAILARYAWHLTKPLDLGSMEAACGSLIGRHDFASFGMPDKPGGSTIREIFDSRIRRKRDAVYLTIKADGYLRGMVRAIVGTLAEIGQGKREVSEMDGMLKACDRRAAGVSAPPQGLFLTRIEY